MTLLPDLRPLVGLAEHRLVPSYSLLALRRHAAILVAAPRVLLPRGERPQRLGLARCCTRVVSPPCSRLLPSSSSSPASPRPTTGTTTRSSSSPVGPPSPRARRWTASSSSTAR